MRKRVLGALFMLLLISGNVFAGDGDLIVNGGFKGGTVTAACNASLSGYMRWSGTEYQVCNGTSWTSIGGLAGEVKMYAGSAAPSGWLVCDGSAVSRTTYAALFAVIGTTYGAGDGSTTFNLPDLRGRTTIGVGQGNTGEGGVLGTNRALASVGGTETHTLTLAQIPSNNIITYRYWNHYYGSFTGIANSDVTTYPQTVNLTGGGNGAHNNMMPYLTLNFIIKY